MEIEDNIKKAIAYYISKHGTGPDYIIMNDKDFLAFKTFAESKINCVVIDVNAEVKYMGRKIIRTNNMKMGEIFVGSFE